MNKKNGGFTLIEVALAVLVVAIGVMAVFALISGGLDANAEGVADTQSAIFAENVFSALQVASEEAARRQTFENYYANPPDINDTTWYDDWYEIYLGNTPVKVAASEFWHEEYEVTATPNPSDPVNVLSFSNAPQHDASINGLVNGALRYKLRVNFTPPVPDTTDFGPQRAEVTLKVWDGLYGSDRDEDAMIYYSEFNSQGDL